jgi:hypothetical protein
MLFAFNTAGVPAVAKIISIGSSDPASYDFGGMYGYGNGTARYPNNAYTNPATGAASCPSGYTARAVLGRSGVDWPLYFCYR